MKAVVELGGKQYLIEPGTIFQAEKVPAEKGSFYTTDRVLVILDGDNVLLGKPYVADGKVTFTVLDQTKTRKVHTVKFRAKKGYLRTASHRQEVSQLQVELIEGGGKREERLVEKKRKRKKETEEPVAVEAAAEEAPVEKIEKKVEKAKPSKKAPEKPKTVKKEAAKSKTTKKAPAKTTKKDAAPKTRKKKEDK